MTAIKAIILCIIAIYSTSALSEVIIIGGSGTDLATFKLLAKGFKKENPDTKFKILPSIGSGGGIKAAKAEKIDICLTSRAPKDKELSQDIIFKRYAQTPFVFSVHEDLNVDNVTTQNILDIYSGAMTQWDTDTQIKPILRPSNDSDTTLLIEVIPGFDEAINIAYKRRGLPMATTDQDAIELIQNVDGSIGGSSLSIVKTSGKSVKAINFNSTEPTPENIKNGSYTLYKDLYLCYNHIKITPSLNRFIDFILSDDGKNILNITGHVSFKFKK